MSSNPLAKVPACARTPLACLGLLLVLADSPLSLLAQPVPAPSAHAAASPAAVLSPDGPPQAWVDSAVAIELKIIADQGTFPLRYRMRKIDAKGDITREVIDTQQGSVARLVQRDGQPLTPAQDAAEQDRLNAILASPADFVRHHKRDSATRDDTLQIVRLMPQAMLYTYAPGQPQVPGAASPQVVIDFRPNPTFHTPNMAAGILTGLEGRVWIDARSRTVIRAEARVLRPVNFGWGIIGRVYPGGTVEFEQTSVAANHWAYSHLVTHLNLRVLVKTVAMNDQMSATNFEVLPGPLSVQQAIQQLLAMPVQLR